MCLRQTVCLLVLLKLKRIKDFKVLKLSDSVIMHLSLIKTTLFQYTKQDVDIIPEDE